MTARRRSLALAAPHVAAAEAGRAAFADGGTAVDAALAACATLTAVYPHMCSIGGDAIALVHAPDGTVTAVNGSGAAPAALDAARVRAALERDPAPVTRTGMPVRGPHTVTVPGVLAAWETLGQLGSALPLARLLRAAVGFAADGCPVSPSLAASLAAESKLFAADPGLREVFFRPSGGGRGGDARAGGGDARAGGGDGRGTSGLRPLRRGEVYRQPALASSLEAIARHGAGAFYRGELGARYVAGLRAAGSVITTDDLASHATETLAPLCGAAFGHEVLTAPPNSQGYVLLQLLAAFERLPGDVAVREASGTRTSPPDPLGPAAGRLARLFRLASDERDAHLCDPRAHALPLDKLLAAGHIKRLVAEGADRPPAHEPGPAAGDTIACVAADSDGWAAAIIQSIYHGFGAAILEPSTGIVAHDRGACFSLDPASPNLLAGGMRPLHTLMPVMVRRRGRLAIVAGTMGGEAQPQIHAQILSRLLRYGAGDGHTDPAAAVAAPRWIYDEGAILAEDDVPPVCLDALRDTGMPLEMLGRLDEAVGHAQYVRIAQDGGLEAASDPRADGAGLVASA